jgi:Prokaryotic membrane lipoprotein lipid attachment site
MRQIIFATAALLLLSGCQTSGYNPLKIETQEGAGLATGVKQILTLLMGRAD